MSILKVEKNDDVRFIDKINEVILHLLERCAFEEFYLLRTNNWFDYKWCRHPRHTRPHKLPIPPFHPNRIVSQRYFRIRDDQSGFEPCGQGESIHLMDVTDDDPRRVVDVVPEAALFWFSGNTIRNTRASFMAYLPTEDEHWPWYVGYVRKDEWKPSFFENISRAEFESITSDLRNIVSRDGT